jgi:holo-[acyl-carrier protein] synthase
VAAPPPTSAAPGGGGPERPLPRVGHDLVSLARFRHALARHEEGFRRRVFTPGEWSAVRGRGDRAAALAARFAAKEAAMKALGTGWGSGVAWRDLEVVGGGGAPPRIVLHGRAAALAADYAGLAVSLAHDAECASAFVLAWPR